MEAMRLGHAHAQRYDALHEGLAMAGEGWALEMGVHRGTTLRMIAAERPDKVVGFDSLCGLPEDWMGEWVQGTFAMEQPPIVDGADFVAGWFTDTVKPWTDAHPGRIAFIHVDCDLYSSTKDVFDAIGHRLEPGCVIVFDEYHNYPGWEQHEARAWLEYTAAHPELVYTMIEPPGVQQVIVVIDGFDS